MKTGVISWDWKGQVDWDEVSAITQTMMWPRIYEVQDTGGDSFAIVIADINLTLEQVQDVYENYCNEEA